MLLGHQLDEQREQLVNDRSESRIRNTARSPSSIMSPPSNLATRIGTHFGVLNSEDRQHGADLSE
jgi:hypothetical protein